MFRLTDRRLSGAALAAALLAAMLGLALPARAAGTVAGAHVGVGRAATPAELKAWDIDVRPDFKGLPPGSGSVAGSSPLPWSAMPASPKRSLLASSSVTVPPSGEWRTALPSRLTRIWITPRRSP